MREETAEPERKGTEAADAYSVYEEIIKDNIEYDYLIQDRYLDRDRICLLYTSVSPVSLFLPHIFLQSILAISNIPFRL